MTSTKFKEGPPGKPPDGKKKRPAGTGLSVRQRRGQQSIVNHYGLKCNTTSDACQDLTKSFNLAFNYTHCIKPPVDNQYTAARALVDQASERMERAEKRGDDDAWVTHFAVYLAVWPLAFADAMEATL